MNELKQCPFCGGDAEKRYIKRKKLFASMRFPYNTHYVYVKCKVCGAEGVKEMTRLECAVKLLWNLRFRDTCNSEDVEAFAYAIMELGRSELEEEVIKRNEKPPRYEVNSPIKMESDGAPPREWM